MRTPAKGKRPRRAQPVSFPATTGGWIANRSLAIGRDPRLPPGAAVLDNWFPTSTGIILRRGRERRHSIGNSPVRSMFTYISGSTNQLFAAVDGEIVNVSTSTASTAYASGSNGDWVTQQFSTPGGDFLIGVNGTDDAWIYDGATFDATGITFPGGSALDTSSLAYVWSYAERLWFIQRDTLSVWYLPVDSIAGELTELPLGGVFQLGGSLLWGQAWSLTSGGQGGLSEQVVFTTTEGEVLAYQGANPDSATDFARVGLYRIGEPLGKKGWFRAGGDLMIATSIGLVSLAKASGTDLAALGGVAISHPIEEAWTGAVQTRGMTDWRCTVWPEGKMLVVSPPFLSGHNQDCFVANVNSGAWCRFTNWDVSAMSIFNGQLQFGDSEGTIWLANVTGSDDETPYTGVCIPLYEDMGAPANRKIARMGRVVKRSRYRAREKLTAMFDFDITPPSPPNALVEVSDSLWGTANWGEGVWGAEAAETVTTDWKSLGGSGQDVSVCLQVTSGTIYPVDVEIIRADATIETADVVS